MPAKSKSQQRFFGVVKGIQKGSGKGRGNAKKAADNISKSRNIAHAHYASDSKMGEKLGKEMYNYIKNKI